MAAPERLSFGQLSTWRYLQRWPRQRWHEANLTRVHALRDGVRMEVVRQALESVSRHHQTLRTSLDLGSEQPRQVVHEHPAVSLVVREGEPTPRLRAELSGVSFGFTEDFGWCATVLLSRGAPAFLVLVYSHVVVDGWSMHHLDGELAPLLRDPVPDNGHRVTLLRGPGHLAAAQHGEPWAPRRASALAHWRDVTRDPVAAPATGEAGAPMAECSWGSLRLGTHTELVSEIARRARVFVPTVLTALLTLALRRGRWGPVVVWLMSANRTSAPWRNLVGAMNQAIPMIVAPEPAMSLGEFLTQVQNRSLAAFRNGCYDVDAAAEVCAETLGAPLAQEFLVNQVASATSAHAPHDEPRLEIGPSPRGTPAKVYTMITGETSLVINVYTARSAMGRDELETGLRWLIGALPVAAGDGEVRLARL